jgi:osmotically-inducible protein OsmY
VVVITALASALALVLLAGGQGIDAAKLMARTEVKVPLPATAGVAAEPRAADTPAGEAGEAVARFADAELSMRLLNRLMERGHLSTGCLAIATADSSVRLEGNVRRAEDRTAIERLVAAEPGVLHVTNNLQTKPCPSQPDRRRLPK